MAIHEYWTRTTHVYVSDSGLRLEINYFTYTARISGMKASTVTITNSNTDELRNSALEIFRYLDSKLGERVEHNE